MFDSFAFMRSFSPLNEAIEWLNDVLAYGQLVKELSKFMRFYDQSEGNLGAVNCISLPRYNFVRLL